MFSCTDIIIHHSQNSTLCLFKTQLDFCHFVQKIISICSFGLQFRELENFVCFLVCLDIICSNFILLPILFNFFHSSLHPEKNGRTVTLQTCFCTKCCNQDVFLHFFYVYASQLFTCTT